MGENSSDWTWNFFQLVGDNFGFYDPYAPDAKMIVARILEEQVNIVLFYGS